MEEKNFIKAQSEVKNPKTENEIKNEIEKNYKIGIEYYQDIEKDKENKNI